MRKTLALLTLPLLCGCPYELPQPEPEPQVTTWDADSVDALVITAADGVVSVVAVAGAAEIVLASGEGVTGDLVGSTLTLDATGDLALTTPPEPDWTVTVQDGEVSVVGMSGAGLVRSTRASVSCLEVSGPLDVQVEDEATVGAQVSEQIPEVSVESGGGAIVLDVRADVSASLQAHTSAGVVELTGVDFSGTHLGDDAQGDLGDGQGSIRLLTGAGDISITGS